MVKIDCGLDFVGAVRRVATSLAGWSVRRTFLRCCCLRVCGIAVCVQSTSGRAKQRRLVGRGGASLLFPVGVSISDKQLYKFGRQSIDCLLFAALFVLLIAFFAYEYAFFCSFLVWYVSSISTTRIYCRSSGVLITDCFFYLFVG